MPGQRRIIPRQLEIIITFMERNTVLARGALSKEGGPLGKQLTTNKWKELSDKLNAVPGGTVKTTEAWRQYWSNLKYKTRAKAVEAKRHMGGTGGGPPSEESFLTEEEDRIICILGEDSIFGEESVRIPFEESEVPTQQASVRVSQLSAEHSYAILSQGAGSDTPQVPASMAGVETTADENIFMNSSQNVSSATPRVPISMGPIARPSNRGNRRQIPNIPEWAVAIEERNTEAQERQAAALEVIVELIRKIIILLNSRSRNQC